MSYENIANILMEFSPDKNVCAINKLHEFAEAEAYHASEEFQSLLQQRGFVFHKDILLRLLHEDWTLLKREENKTVATKYKLDDLIQFFDDYLQKNPLSQQRRSWEIPEIIKNYSIKTPLHNVALPWMEQGVIVHSLRSRGHALSTKTIHRKSRLPVMIPVFEDIPAISFQKPGSNLGNNFVQLQGEKLWKLLDDEAYGKLAPYKEIIQCALKDFLQMINGPGRDSTPLFASGKLFIHNLNRAKMVTHYLLSERIQYYYDENNICKKAEVMKLGHIEREKVKSNLNFWDENTRDLTMTRRMAVDLSKESGHSLLESMCAVLTALRIIETLLCSGYVINVIKYGRFMAKKINKPISGAPYNSMEYRIAFLEWPQYP